MVLGIEESAISKILVTGKSLKRERDAGKFGFMGYGFTFVAFQSEYLQIESIKNRKKASRTYRDLYKFVYSGSDIPNSEEEDSAEQAQDVDEKNGTKITLKFPLKFPEEVVEESLAATFRIAKSDKTIIAVLRTQSIVGGGDSRINNPLYDPKEELTRIFKSKNWFDSILTQKYLPPVEEQEVISLFVELIAQKVLRGYYLKVLSGYQVYDGLYEYRLDQTEEVEYSEKNNLGIHKNIFNANGKSLKKEILIEFKRELIDIYKDISSNKKDISHIDILVVWDVKFKDKEDLQRDKGDIIT